MGKIIANDVLTAVSYALVEDVVRAAATTNPIGVTFGPGAASVVVSSDRGLYIGAQVVVGVPGTVAPATGTPEVVSITAIVPQPAGFVLQFACLYEHNDLEPIVGATFPSGQLIENPLFTQEEMLGYLAEVQNDFLLQARPIYAAAAVAIQTGKRIYAQPEDCIRMERVAIQGTALDNVSQADLDMEDSTWESNDKDSPPSAWYQDKLGTGKFGTGRGVPQNNFAASVWYSKRAPTAIALADTLLVPDVCSQFLKYGVLERVFSQDGEMRSQAMAGYCHGFYVLGVQMTSKFLQGVEARMVFEGPRIEPMLESMGIQ